MKITDFLSMDDVFLLDNVKNKFEIYEKVFPKFIEIENNAKIEKNIVTTQASQKLEISSFYTRLRREEEGDLRGVARTHGKDYSSPLL